MELHGAVLDHRQQAPRQCPPRGRRRRLVGCRARGPWRRRLGTDGVTCFWKKHCGADPVRAADHGERAALEVRDHEAGDRVVVLGDVELGQPGVGEDEAVRMGDRDPADDRLAGVGGAEAGEAGARGAAAAASRAAPGTAATAAARFVPSPPRRGASSSSSRTTSAAGLSSRSPLKTGWRRAAVAGPLAEADLGDQVRRRPVHAAGLRPARRVGERRRAPLERVEPLAQPRQGASSKPLPTRPA